MLLVREVGGRADVDPELRRRVMGGVGEVRRDLDLPEIPALAVRVHLDRGRLAAGEGGGEQLGRRWALVPASVVLLLVDDQAVLADLDLMLVSLATARDSVSPDAPSLPSNI